MGLQGCDSLDRTVFMINCNSGAIGIFLKGLTFAPPVLPDGIKPKMVFVAAPVIRKICPATSLLFRLRMPQSSIKMCVLV